MHVLKCKHDRVTVVILIIITQHQGIGLRVYSTRYTEHNAKINTVGRQ